MKKNQSNSESLPNTKPEREKVEIFDDDDAYMLNDDKDNVNVYTNDDKQMYNSQDEQENQGEDNENYGNDLDAERENNTNEYNDIDEVELNDSNVKDDTVRDAHFNNQNLNSNIINKNGAIKNTSASKNKDKQRKISNLITLKYISVCQCCKENFNSSANIPFLLKCGHFFCRSCLENNFTEDDGKIFCPDDGIVANSISDLKLLNNLIIDKSIDEDVGDVVDSNREKVFCSQHPEQKLSHYIEETREVICVYCAFNKFKKNPKHSIKEIKEKCQEIIEEIDNVIENNQHYVEILQHSLKEIKDNKLAEEKRVNSFHENIKKYLETKKDDFLWQINNIFESNADKLSTKLDYFSGKIEESEELKAHIVAVLTNNHTQINEVLKTYVQYKKEANDYTNINLELVEYKFSHDDETKLTKYLNNFGDLKTKSKHVIFAPNNPKTGINFNQNSGDLSNPRNNNWDDNFKSIRSNPQQFKRNYDSIQTSSSKNYPQFCQTETGTNSGILNRNNENIGTRINTQKSSNYLLSSNNSNDLLASDPYYSVPLKNPVSNFSNYNRIDFSTSNKYSFTRDNLNDYSYEPRNRNMDFGRHFSRTPEIGKNFK